MRIVLLFSCLLALCGGLAQGKLIHINEENWREVLQGEWMLEFFAPWCPACRALQTSWEEFSTWDNDLEINVAQVDVTNSPGLSGRFMVTALPTIFHVKNGIFRQYRGARDKDSFIMYVEEKKWESVEPISDWKAPDSLQMSAVSYFFKLSMILRNVHTTLTEEYQLPSWASYIAFACATILLGGVLGLLMVCCIDCIWPPRRDVAPHPQRTRDDKKDSDVEEDDDDEGEMSQEEDLDLGSQDEGTEPEDEEGASQDEAGSQDEEGEGSQAEEEGSQAEEEEGSQAEEEGSNNKSRRRKARKAD